MTTAFFPYESHIPIFYGITSKEQEKVIEPEADGNYLLKNPKGEHEVIISIWKIREGIWHIACRAISS